MGGVKTNKGLFFKQVSQNILYCNKEEKKTSKITKKYTANVNEEGCRKKIIFIRNRKLKNNQNTKENLGEKSDT